MSGTKSGGLKAAATNKKKFGSDYYARIGALGGKKSTIGGFYANRELASEAGKKGGLISRRGKKLTQQEKERILQTNGYSSQVSDADSTGHSNWISRRLLRF